MQELNQTIRTCGFESMLSSSVTFINEDLDSLQASHLDMNLDLYHFIEYNGGPSLSPNYEEHMAIFKRVRKKKYIYIYIFLFYINKICIDHFTSKYPLFSPYIFFKLL